VRNLEATLRMGRRGEAHLVIALIVLVVNLVS
jgi:hypothetical protein